MATVAKGAPPQHVRGADVACSQGSVSRWKESRRSTRQSETTRPSIYFAYGSTTLKNSDVESKAGSAKSTPGSPAHDAAEQTAGWINTRDHMNTHSGAKSTMALPTRNFLHKADASTSSYKGVSLTSKKRASFLCEVCFHYSSAVLALVCVAAQCAAVFFPEDVPQKLVWVPLVVLVLLAGIWHPKCSSQDPETIRLLPVTGEHRDVSSAAHRYLASNSWVLSLRKSFGMFLVFSAFFLLLVTVGRHLGDRKRLHWEAIAVALVQKMFGAFVQVSLASSYDDD
ncbi:unnamed protein product [Amoebophrya sp. A25]|nr:unnamed protein product [Amoebophrya sp. A25]|eukprot:GSA25T00025306001.1